jgi:hypothetical protein
MVIPDSSISNDTADDIIPAQSCLHLNFDNAGRKASMFQVSFDSTDDKIGLLPPLSDREDVIAQSVGLSTCNRPSSPLPSLEHANRHMDDNVLLIASAETSCKLDKDDDRILENEMNRRSPDNSLVDSMDDEVDDTDEIPPPPPPPIQPKPRIDLRRQSTSSSIPALIVPARRLNRVSLHIYDLISSDTLMQLPWGCVCEIGKCFNEVNSALHELGTGAYHVGIECNGIEYAYGACSQPNKTGVFSCIPKLSPGYQYRTSIDFGYIPLIRSSWVVVPATSSNEKYSCSSPRSVTSNSSSAFHYQEDYVDGRLVIKEMAAEYMGIDYDILKRNCCTFAADACVRLGVPEDDVPTWFRNLAETGAYSHTNFVEPLQHVLSGVSQPNNSHSISGAYHHLKTQRCSSNDHYYSRYTPNQQFDSNSYYGNNDPNEPGFELIAKRNASNTRDVVVVIDATTDSWASRPLRSYRKSVTTAY